MKLPLKNKKSLNIIYIFIALLFTAIIMITMIFEEIIQLKISNMGTSLFSLTKKNFINEYKTDYIQKYIIKTDRQIRAILTIMKYLNHSSFFYRFNKLQLQIQINLFSVRASVFSKINDSLNSDSFISHQQKHLLSTFYSKLFFYNGVFSLYNNKKNKAVWSFNQSLKGNITLHSLLSLLILNNHILAYSNSKNLLSSTTSKDFLLKIYNESILFKHQYTYILQNHNSTLSQVFPEKYINTNNEIMLYLLHCMLIAESNLDPNAVSAKKALGISQITESSFNYIQETLNKLGNGTINTNHTFTDLKTPEISLFYFLSYLYIILEDNNAETMLGIFLYYNSGQKFLEKDFFSSLKVFSHFIKSELKSDFISDDSLLLSFLLSCDYMKYPATSQYIKKIVILSFLLKNRDIIKLNNSSEIFEEPFTIQFMRMKNMLRETIESLTEKKHT